MYHQNISWWRKRRFAETTLGAYDAAHPPPDIDLRLTLDAALAQLTSKQRTVLVLRFSEDLTEAQTAEAIGISISTVKSTSRNALARACASSRPTSPTSRRWSDESPRRAATACGHRTPALDRSHRVGPWPLSASPRPAGDLRRGPGHGADRRRSRLAGAGSPSRPTCPAGERTQSSQPLRPGIGLPG